LRVMPVDHRMVEADLQPLVAKRLHHRLQQIALGWRIGRLVVGQRRVPEAEAVVVLGGDDKVTSCRHSSPPAPRWMGCRGRGQSGRNISGNLRPKSFHGS
jgi:hypothetical protein